ncbi:MAG: DNA polymerase Y family protein [Sphingomonas sp.]
MKRVAALYLPHWSIDRLRRAERTSAPPEPPRSAASLDAMHDAAAHEQDHACSVPRGGGWRPGARWAREDDGVHARVAALPDPRRPARHEIGRRDEAAGHPFRAMPPDEGGSGRSLPPTHRNARAGMLPLVTALRTENRNLIGAACPLALSIGLVPGMAITQARVLVPGLDIRPADPEGDRAELHRLAIALARHFSPIVAIADDETLAIEISGTDHLFGGEAMMAKRIIRLLARLGYVAQIAVADTLGAAHALSRQARPITICPAGRHAEAIAALPVRALRIDARDNELLKRLGIDRIGELAEIPRAPLVKRFGKQIAIRIHQALGALPEPLHPVVPPQPIAATRRFAEPIATPEAIEHWLGLLVPRIVAALAERGLGALRIELVADRVDGVPQHIRIGLARPSRDPAHLLRLLLRRMESIEPGFGIDAIALHVRRADLLGPEPVVERLDEDAAPDLAPLVDTLATRIGLQRMWRMRPIESDVPERSIARAPVLDPPARSAAPMKADDVRRLDRSPALEPWHPHWPKPARLLRRPERIDHVMAELPDHAPRRFTWRGTAHKIVRADGPERVHGEWWKRASETHSVRDYFRVEDDQGRRYWLFRKGDGERSVTGDLRWYLHGVFG